MLLPNLVGNQTKTKLPWYIVPMNSRTRLCVPNHNGAWDNIAAMPGYEARDNIVANRPYYGGTVPIFYATLPIFLDCCPQIW